MNKIFSFLAFIFLAISSLNAQNSDKYNLNIGVIAQKTQSLYWENGLAADFSFAAILNNKLHLKAGIITSRLGSSMFGNAINQESYLLGLDWRFRASKPFQIFVGCNTGFFYADYDNPVFDVLPGSSMLMAIETGMIYKFKCPVSVSLSAGYNLINGDGVSVPGSLFPVFYKFGLYYKIGCKNK